MKTFFGVMIAIGTLLMFLEWSASRTSDSVPVVFAHAGNLGLLFVVVGIVGELCARWAP